MKNFLLFTLAMSMTLPALAKKVSLDRDTLEEVERVGAISDVRVYLSSSIRIERKSEIKKESDIDSSISRTLKQRILKEKISKKIRGKILAIEGSYNFNDATSEKDYLSAVKTIYVTFDQSCNDKSCAFAFRPTGTLNERWLSGNYQHRGRMKYYLTAIEETFSLSSLPEIAGLKVTNVEIDRFGFNRKLIDSANINLKDIKGRRVRLKVDLSELRMLQIEKKSYQGF